MSDILLKIVNMSIQASVIVVAVMLLRLLLKKAPKWITVLLWAMVAVRLVCPFTFESRASLMPSDETIKPKATVKSDTHKTENNAFVIYDTQTPSANQTVKPEVTPTPDTSVGFAPIITPEKDNAPTDNTSNSKTTVYVFDVIWLCGMAAMLIYAAVSYLRVKRRVSTAVLFKDNVYHCETVNSPFVLGFVKPKIYLPFNIDGQSTEYVIAHESAHIRRLDYIIKPIGFLILTLHWFNPFIWLSFILLCKDIELACDERVIKQLDTHQRADYSQALLSLSTNRFTVAACPLAFGEVGVKTRIKSVLNYKKPAFWIVIAASLAIIATSVCLLTNPISKSSSSDASKTEGEKILAELQQQLSAENQVCGVDYLGGFESYQEFKRYYASIDYGNYPFLKEIDDDRFVEVSDGKEFFVIIPADSKADVAVNRYISDDGMDTFYKGETLYEAKKDGNPIVVKCNLVDLYTDARITVTDKGEKTIEFSPQTSLKDGRLEINTENENLVYNLNTDAKNQTVKKYFERAINGTAEVHLYGGETCLLAACPTYYGYETLYELASKMAYIDFDGDGIDELLIDELGYYILNYDFEDNKIYATQFTPIGGCVFFENGEYWYNDIPNYRYKITKFDKGLVETETVDYPNSDAIMEQPEWMLLTIPNTTDNTLYLTPNNSKSELYNEAVSYYNLFLNRDINAVQKQSGKAMAVEYRADAFGDADIGTYELFDVNDDGMPELHIQSQHYSVYSYKNGKVEHWYTSGHNLANGPVYPLQNGALFTEKVSTEYEYYYTTFDKDGTVTEIYFAEPYEGAKYPTYFFNDQEVTAKEYEGLTKKYKQLSKQKADINWQGNMD